MHKPICYSTAAILAASMGFVATGQQDAPTAEPQVINAFEDERLPEGQGVEVGTTGEVFITVVDLDVTKVLQLLSMQSQRNIVASKSVSGEVSASLNNVDFYDALDAILMPNGFGYLERGSFIYVYTAEELAEQEAATRVPVYEVLTLNYISAADAAAFIAPLLSERGVVTASAEPAAGIDPSIGDAGANTFAHPDTLMVRDYEENLEEIKAVLAQLDTRPKQVKIEATILEARLTDENRFGIDFALFSNLDFNTFFGPFASLGSGGTGTAVGGQLESTAGIGTDTAGALKVGVTGNQGSILVDALDQITDTTLLANPQILVLNRQRARLQVGENLGYVTTTRTDVSDSETVEFLETGTTLNVRPFISNDDYVRMELTPEVSNGSIDQTTGTTIPSETLETLTTNVIVKSGQTVVLGGLFKEDTEVGRTQIPWAGDIPVVGLLGSTRNTSSSRSEVIFMIRPTVMKDQALFDTANRTIEMTQRVRVGAREALLPFSRMAMVQGHLKNAYEALDAGDTKKAKWYVDLALYINPVLPEAIELREKITGEKTFYRSHSIMKSMVDDMVSDQVGSAVPVDPQPIAEAADAEAKAQAPGTGSTTDAAGTDGTAAAPDAAELIDVQPVAEEAVEESIPEQASETASGQTPQESAPVEDDEIAVVEK